MKDEKNWDEFNPENNEDKSDLDVVFKEKTKSEKSKNKIIIILIVFIFLFVEVTGAYFVFYKQNDTKTENEIVEEETVISQEESIDVNADKKESVIKEEVDDSLAQKLYSYIPYMTRHHQDRNVYQGNNVVTFDLTDDDLILRKAWDLLELKDSQVTCIDLPEGEKCTADEEKYWFEFDSKLLDEKVFEMYNSRVPNKRVELDYSSGLIYNESTQKYRYNFGGGDCFPPLHIRKFLSAERVGNEIYIYDLYLYGVINYEDHEVCIPNYKFFQSTTDIFNSNDVNISYDLSEKEAGSDFDETLLVNDILKNDTLKMARYKHVFKLSDDDNWYWYSTSMVN